MKGTFITNPGAVSIAASGKLEGRLLSTNKLVDNDETIWFFVNGDKDKFWFYEGKVKTIITI